MPVVALLPALGAAWLLEHGWLKALNRLPETVFHAAPMPGLGFGLLSALIVGVSAIRLFSSTPALEKPACENGQEAAVLRYLPGSFVRIDREMNLFLDWLPNYHEGRYVRYVHNLPNAPEINEFAGIEVPATLINGLDLVTGNDIYFMAATDQMPEQYGLITACGRYSDSPEVESFHFYYPEKIELIESR
jgi:hypothetical protein